MPLKTNNQTEDWINKEAGTILTLAREFAEEAQAFVAKNGDIEVDRTDKENYSPEARTYFLYLKWYALWGMAADDLRLDQLVAALDVNGLLRPARPLEVEDQGGNSIDLYVFSTESGPEPGPSHVWSLETGLNM